ncbi:MAG: ATP-binding protein, partial [Candidatus Competibacteraceae bacterium]|nr:ATP-binding protein [Candidatus Competibacteraceae bacterium]
MPDSLPDDQDEILGQSLLEGLRGDLHLVAGGLALLYVLLSLGHLLVLPVPLKAPLTTTAAASALLLGWAHRHLKLHPPPPGWVYPLALIIAGVVMINSLLHLYLSAEPQHTTNLILLLIGLGYFLLSHLWYMTALIMVLLLWVGVVAAVGQRAPADQWVHFGFALLIGSVVASLIHTAHARNLRRLQWLRLRDEQKSTRLLREVEERHRAERALRERQAQLAHAGRLNLAGEMASGLAHEINQPLAAISLYAQTGQSLLQMETLDKARLEQLLERIGAQSQRAGEVINRIKHFTRASPPQRQAVDLNDLVRDTLDFIDYDLERTAVEVKLDLTADLPQVEVDPIQIQQVLLNLLRNAQEALQGLPASQRRILLSTQALPDGRVEVRVTDQGPGLSPRSASHLFQPFFTTKPQGTGLGLSISKNLIDSHSGRLWAISHPQQ